MMIDTFQRAKRNTSDISKGSSYSNNKLRKNKEVSNGINKRDVDQRMKSKSIDKEKAYLREHKWKGRNGEIKKEARIR